MVPNVILICDRVRGNQAFGLEIDFEIRAKNLADGLLQRKCVFHTEVLHDVCGTRLCTLESQNLHAEAARALYTRPCRASPRVRGAIIRRNIRGRVRISFGSKLPAALWERNNPRFHLSEFLLPIEGQGEGHDNAGGHRTTQQPGRLRLRGLLWRPRSRPRLSVAPGYWYE